MDVVLPQRVLDVVRLLVVFPILAQLVNLASHVSLFFHVKSLQQQKTKLLKGKFIDSRLSRCSKDGGPALRFAQGGPTKVWACIFYSLKVPV